MLLNTQEFNFVGEGIVSLLWALFLGFSWQTGQEDSGDMLPSTLGEATPLYTKLWFTCWICVTRTGVPLKIQDSWILNLSDLWICTCKDAHYPFSGLNIETSRVFKDLAKDYQRRVPYAVQSCFLSELWWELEQIVSPQLCRNCETAGRLITKIALVGCLLNSN